MNIDLRFSSLMVPMDPAEVVRKPNGSVRLVCGRCRYKFPYDLSKCPECGQAVRKPKEITNIERASGFKMDEQTFEIMKERYGDIGSWAVWAPAGSTPKSFTDDMSWVNNPDLLKTLNTGFVFIGRCCSRGDPSCGSQKAWCNFHSGYPHQNDYKLRYALKGTRYWGSYITDVYKMDFWIDYQDVDKYAADHPGFVKQNIESLVEEISYLGKDLVLVAMGNSVYKVLDEWLGNRYKVVKILNYAHYISKEEFREKVLEVLDNVEL